jgi:hypothetical protein
MSSSNMTDKDKASLPWGWQPTSFGTTLVKGVFAGTVSCAVLLGTMPSLNPRYTQGPAQLSLVGSSKGL